MLSGFYMNKKHWNTALIGTGVPETLVRAWIAELYKLVAAALPKAERAGLACAPVE